MNSVHLSFFFSQLQRRGVAVVVLAQLLGQPADDNALSLPSAPLHPSDP